MQTTIEQYLDEFFKELQHTPGPWGMDYINDMEAVISKPDITWAIAVCACEPMENEVKANSKLIAQAPDMLRSICRTYLLLLVKFPFNDRQNSTVREIHITLDGTFASLRNEISTATGLECQYVQDTFGEYALQISDGIDVKQHSAWVKQGRPGE